MNLSSLLHTVSQAEREVQRTKLAEPERSIWPSRLRLASNDELEALIVARESGDEATLERIAAVLDERRRNSEPAHPDADAVTVAKPRLTQADVEHAQRRAESPSRFLDCANVEVEIAFDPTPDADGVEHVPQPNLRQATELAPLLDGPEPKSQSEPVIQLDNEPPSPKAKPARRKPQGPDSWQEDGGVHPLSFAAHKRSALGPDSAGSLFDYEF